MIPWILEVPIRSEKCYWMTHSIQWHRPWRKSAKQILLKILEHLQRHSIHQDYPQVLLLVWKLTASFCKQFVTNSKDSEYRNSLPKETNERGVRVFSRMFVIFTHIPLCILNEVERDKFIAHAPGISWEQTEHANIIHLVFTVKKEKGLRAAAWSHQVKAGGYHNAFNKQVHFNFYLGILPVHNVEQFI